MLANNFNSLFNGWGSQVFAGLNKMLDLIKYPGITDRCTTDHYAIYTVPVFIFERFFGGINISIAEDRDLNARVVFHFRDQCPVRLAFVKLRPGPAMNCQRPDTCIL